MLQSSRVTALTVSEILREKQQGVKLPPLSTQIRVTKKIICDRYQCKITEQAQNRYLDFLIDPSLTGLNRFFALSFEDKYYRKSYKRNFFPIIEMKGENDITWLNITLQK